MSSSGFGARERPLILHIDDSSLVLMVTQTMLAGLGYDTITAGSGEDALAVAASRKPDLILVDAMMPGLGGYETVSRMRMTKELKDTPIIMVTGDDTAKSVDRATASGANDYLVKPVQEEHLKIKLAALLKQPPR